MFSSMFGHLYRQKKMFGHLFVGCSFLGFLEKFPLLQGAFAFKTLFFKKLLKPYVSSPTPPHEKNYQGVSFSLIVTRPSKGTKTNQFAAVVDALDFTIDCKKQGCS